MTHVKVVKPASLFHPFYYLAGAIILILNKLRRTVKDYNKPRPFSTRDADQVAIYDNKVIAEWSELLEEYTQNSEPFKGKNILELGPGADLGVGLLALSLGAKSYTAFDKFPLAKDTPTIVYEKICAQLSPEEKTRLMTAAEHASDKNAEPLCYLYDEAFAVSNIQNKKFDLVVSQAAFEHFDNVHKTLTEVSGCVRPGATFFAIIDLQTHSRWIRDADPLNIYRFEDWLYRPTLFAGSPNRERPAKFKSILEANGWTDVEVMPLAIVEENATKKTIPHLAKKFREPNAEMEILSFAIFGTKK